MEEYGNILDRARLVWEKVISLIGYFDLDPNRALDITLDVFSVHLGTHATFFTALLSFSPWAGDFQRPIAVTQPKTAPGTFEGRSLDHILAAMDPTNPKPLLKDESPRVLAQVLGFKFAYYQACSIFTILLSDKFMLIFCRRLTSWKRHRNSST